MATRDYKTLKTQLEKLQVETEAARVAEVKAVIAEIRSRAAEYGLTAEDIFPRKKTRITKATAPLAPKYQDPKTGVTWSGKGRAPAWIRDVKNRDRFLIR
ncbi:H-NS histone family protein [Paraburkholderia lycopersici]|uniref:DNA-binding protein H-NS n=1 Tax=Paraburkholderia lycopersici TaxID=416944 RepID=A0A1G7A3L4_9BURK|nr:H-NS histone family protein [Paraburkholderia lycopersici]SDE09380.1 DNA-binding protein H-NS [Paraburkholderia lycopersici]